MFYIATVQAILLRSETWSLAPSSLKRLEGFYIRAAWQKAGERPAQNEDWSWTYPHLEEMLMTLDLKTIAHYMGMCCQTVTNFIINQPIYELCVGTVRKRGSHFQPFWWDQPMDLDLVQEGGLWPPSQQGRGPVADDDDKDNELDGH
jgi:hypothetical protein